MKSAWSFEEAKSRTDNFGYLKFLDFLTSLPSDSVFTEEMVRLEQDMPVDRLKWYVEVARYNGHVFSELTETHWSYHGKRFGK